MSSSVDLSSLGIKVQQVVRNASARELNDVAVRTGDGEVLANEALAVLSGKKTGRSPKDKRIVEQASSKDDIWWKDNNVPLGEASYETNRAMALEWINGRDTVYVMDGYAGWDPKYQIKVRIVCCRPYHALFMNNMLIRPTAEQLKDFGEPDYVVLNGGECDADPSVDGVTSDTCVTLNLDKKEIVILGTEYAGEMKKGIFSVMHYLMPQQGVLSMHCSANEGEGGDVSLFFGLSGTGKTTLSADTRRKLIGDDEHCWTNDGVFNIEGGCYAKCIRLSPENEPEIYEAIRFGSVLENVVYDDDNVVDYADNSITENTRASYPIEYIPNAKVPCVAGHPKNIILLTCDAFGVLPPVSKLSPAQAMYHFISGYTAKVAGTEVGVTEPQATFSACFGAAFLVWHPTRYAELLAEMMTAHGSEAWLVNTGWTGGGHGVGQRMSLPHTRAIVDAIHSGDLSRADSDVDPFFGVSVPTLCPNVPSEVLLPKQAWQNATAYEESAKKLAQLFNDNFAMFADQASDEIKAAAPNGGVAAGA